MKIDPIFSQNNINNINEIGSSVEKRLKQPEIYDLDIDVQVLKDQAFSDLNELSASQHCQKTVYITCKATSCNCPTMYRC